MLDEATIQIELPIARPPSQRLYSLPLNASSLGNKKPQAEGITTQNQVIVIYPVSPVATYHIPVSLLGHLCSSLIDIDTAVSLINSWIKCYSSTKQDLGLAPWQKYDWWESMDPTPVSGLFPSLTTKSHE